MNLIDLSELLQALCDLDYLAQQHESAFLYGEDKEQATAQHEIQEHALELVEIWRRVNAKQSGEK